MSMPIQVYIFLGIAAIIALIIYISIKADKKRTAAFENWARYNGFSFQKGPSKDYSIGNFQLFNKGYSKKAKNILEGDRSGFHWKIFDYQYTTGYGKNRKTYNQTVAIATMKKAFPKFIVYPENLFHKIGNLLGYKDIDFDNYPNFSKAYFLKGQDEPAIRSVFNPTVLQYFESNRTYATIESDTDKLLYYRSCKKIKLSELSKFIDDVTKILSIFS